MDPFRSYCHDHGIDVPFLPTAVQEVEKDALYATYDPERSPYDIKAFVQEALSKPTHNFVLIGNAGHGVVSRAFHYYVETDNLAVFVQLKEGQDSSRRIEATLGCVQDLFEMMKEKHLPPGKRMVVEISDFEQVERWTWVEPGNKKIEWHDAPANESVLLSASDALAEID